MRVSKAQLAQQNENNAQLDRLAQQKARILASGGLSGLHIAGKRWFDKVNGNTYHSVAIFANGEQLAYVPYTYGYGEQWLQTALDWLAAQGYIPADHEYGTRYLREELHGTYTVADVARKKDL